jgi:hypothetical protein
MSDDIMDPTDPIPTPAAPVGNAATRAVPAPAAVNDLSRQIEQLVEREPLDAVRCVRVFGNFYRCNWWSRLGAKRAGRDFDWGGFITDHVRQSRFLKATVRGEEIILEEVPTGAAGRRSIVA